MIPSSMVVIKRAIFLFKFEYFRTAAGMMPEDAVARSFLENSLFLILSLLFGFVISCKFFNPVLSYKSYTG